MIYLDHAAATPVLPEVLEAMQPYFTERFFNPSAAYLPAQQVANDYAAAKATIAHAIGAKASDLVMTASATEANNLALGAVSPSGELVYLATEHASIREAVPAAAHAVRVHPNGRVDLTDLKAKLTDQTELVSMALVNNELGTIQPLAEVAALIRQVRAERLARGNKRPLWLHSDASQALNLLDVNVARLGVDLLTLNAAKISGPKGVGALYLAHQVQLKPQTRGGGQERGLRSGTENVPGVIGFAKAIEIAQSHLTSNRRRYADFKRILLAELQEYQLINTKYSLDNFVVLCYNGIDGERLLYLLEEKQVYVATGAACAASKGQKSHVLAALGLSDSEIAGSLRLTLGVTNDEAQMHQAARLINAAVEQERRRCAEIS